MDREILKCHENERYKGERLHMLQYPGVCQLFILACIVADAFTLFSLFDLLLTQKVGITWVITITVAATMNITPMLLAACLRNEELSKPMKAVLCTVLSVLFLLLFSITFTLRFTSQEQLYDSSSDLAIAIQNETVEETVETDEETFKPTPAQNILAIILGCEPLATSICCFVLAYEASPVRKKQHLQAQQNVDLEEIIDQDRVMIQELEADLNFDLDEYDRRQYENGLELLELYGERAKNIAPRKLTEHEGTPESVSYLMEGGYLENEKEIRQRENTPEKMQKLNIA